MERADIAIIGTGPGGVSAALTAKVRNKNILLIGKKQMSDKVSKAHQIMNYPGLPAVTGAGSAQSMRWATILQSRQARKCLRQRV